MKQLEVRNNKKKRKPATTEERKYQDGTRKHRMPIKKAKPQDDLDDLMWDDDEPIDLFALDDESE